MTLTRSLPLDLDFLAYAGTTFEREFRWRPGGVDLQDFTGWSALLLIGARDGFAVLELASPDTGVELTNVGQILITLTPDQTEALRGSLYYQLDLTDPDDEIIRFLRGRFTVVHDVARVTP